MKILLIHYRYYEASGPEKYLFNIAKLFEAKGHEVIPFSLNYPNNKTSSFSKYFPDPVIPEFHINKNKKSLSFTKKLKIIKNGFFNNQVYNNLSLLIKEHDPEIAYVLQYGTKLSTSIFDILNKKKIPVVLRLSDFNLICAKNIFFRDESVCTKCIDGKFNSVVHKCVHDSYLQSLIYFGIQKFNELKYFEKKINAIITPSKFTLNILKSTKQFKNNNFFHVPTFINNKTIWSSNKSLKYQPKRDLRLCYVGRIAEDKGIDILIDSFKKLSSKNLNLKLDIYGNDENEFSKSLKVLIKNYELNNINFKGFCSNKKVNKLFKNYHYSVIPSKWFDNMPNSFIESSTAGVPVIASRIGSLNELVKDGYNGFLFEPLNSKSLSKVIENLHKINKTDYENLCKNSYDWISKYCDSDKHYFRLNKLFKSLIDEKNYK
jgi:glycosyltransferase involved in cell wall biosynthesis